MPIVEPTQGQIFPPGSDILLVGYDRAFDPETHEPPTVGSVSYRVDGGAWQPLVPAVTISKPWTIVVYSHNVGVLADGDHVITVIVEFSVGAVEESVGFTVGEAPTTSDLTGSCTLKSALTLSSTESVGLTFSPPSGGAARQVTIQSFPTITFNGSFGSLTLNAVVTLINAGTGQFDSTTGAITIPGVVLAINASGSIAVSGVNFPLPGASATLTTSLTSELTSTPEAPRPVFSDSGERLQPGGQVILVGDGVYSAPVYGMTDGGVTLVGTLSPQP